VNGLRILLGARARSIANAIRTLWRKSLLKVIIISSFSAGFIGGIFVGFYKGFHFLQRQFGADAHLVLEPFFALFFASLGVMLIFSNGVILYGSLMRTRETAGLVTLPLEAEDIFLYRFIEAILFSSWAFIVLAVPMMLAYALVTGVSWIFYVGAFLVIVPFVVIPAGLGALVTVFLARYGPKAPKKALVYAAVLLVVLGAIFFVDYMRIERTHQVFTESWHRAVLRRLDFLQSEIWPSYWLAKTLFFLATEEVRKGAFYFAVLAANALMASYLAVAYARRKLFEAYSACHTGRRRRTFRGDRVFTALVNVFFFFLPKQTRQMVIKDFKTFRRDPAQWAQFLIFFGLLAVYFVNIRRLRYHVFAQPFISFISLLNLGTTSLVLATFTSRFVFPQVSLESTRIWVIGLAPIDRGKILSAKFAFSFVAAALISIPLILVSDYMLKTPIEVMVLHVAALVLVSLGLAGLSVGFGAIFPSLKEENPSKIVSGFGGTINLMASITYIALMVALCGIPTQMYYGPAILGEVGSSWIVAGSIAGLALTAAVATVPYAVGLKKFRNMEF